MNIHQNISGYKLILYGIKSGSILKINGKTVNYNGSSVSRKVYPGTYRISITKKGYYDYTKTIKITQDYSIRIY